MRSSAIKLTPSAAVDIGAPSADHPAATIGVYYDTIYKTYAFVRTAR